MVDGAKVKSMVARLRNGGVAGRRGFPAWAKAEVTAFAARAHESGMSYPAIAATVGVSVNSLLRWMQTDTAPRRSLVPVTIVEPGSTATVTAIGEAEASGPNEARVVVVSPRGYRLEGLSVSEAASLFRGLP